MSYTLFTLVYKFTKQRILHYTKYINFVCSDKHFSF